MLSGGLSPLSLPSTACCSRAQSCHSLLAPAGVPVHCGVCSMPGLFSFCSTVLKLLFGQFCKLSFQCNLVQALLRKPMKYPLRVLRITSPVCGLKLKTNSMFHLCLPSLPFPNLFPGNDPFVAASSDSHTHTQYSRAVQIPFPHKGNSINHDRHAI